MKKTQQADFTEQNLEYFKKATWKIKKDTYEKVKSYFIKNLIYNIFRFPISVIQIVLYIIYYTVK